MHLIPFSLAVSCLLSIAVQDALATPASPPTPRSIPLFRRASPHANNTEWMLRQKHLIESKYGRSGALQARASGLNLLTNQDADSSFYGSLAVGTPAISFNVILDTGSADLWIAASDGTSLQNNKVPTFDSNASSTFEDLNTSFAITYGSGSAQGNLGKDIVQMAGFQVSDQVFGVVTQVQSNLLTEPVSGLLGLGFQSIASSGAKPFWQALASGSGTLDEPIMAFQLTRFVNDSNARKLEPGGTFNIGAVNNSLFTGNIDYQAIPNGEEGYWIQQLTSLTVNGASVTLPPGPGSFAAIDTGTTLVGGPPDVISAIYGQIDGSRALTGSQTGYYSYPCDTAVTVTMQFGSSSVAWPISPADFRLTQVSQNVCVGGFFALDTQGTSAPPWIIGDMFLKNVYSVFRAGSQPAVGFAALSNTALAMNGQNGAPPSPTVGSISATVTGSTNRPNRGASRSRVVLESVWLAVAGTLAGVVAAPLLL